MTALPTKTEAETAIAEEFDRIGSKLPGGRAVAAVRRDAMATFRARGLPHRRVEEWKYTDLRAALKDALPLGLVDDTNVSSKDLSAALGPLADVPAHRVVLVNGHVRPELSTRLDGLPRTDLRPLGNALKVMTDEAATRILKPIGPAAESMAALNTALATDGLVASIGAAPDRPIMIVHVEAGQTAAHRVIRNTIGVLPGVKASIVEVFVALASAKPGQVNTATEISVGEGAEVDHVKITIGGSLHVGSAAPTLAASSIYRTFVYSAGTAFARHQTFPLFVGENAKLDISGVLLGRERNHADLTFVIDHAVPACESRELIKTVLDGRARTVCQGKVIVRPDAQKTDGKQMAQALMLSETAEFDSKPELEIYADDVVCGHGSTCAEIDADKMFYLRSRGIPSDAARALLIDSFVGEAIEKIAHEAIREAVRALAQAWLRV